MSFNLDDVVTKIAGYSTLLKSKGFAMQVDGGIKPWTARWLHADGRAIDVRSSDWTAYDASGVEVKVGHDHTDLAQHFES